MQYDTSNKRGVFSRITGVDGSENLLEDFINETAGMKTNEKLGKLMASYKKKVDNIRKTLDELTKEEELILQLRTRETFKTTDIKLFLIRNEYIYARANFYRHKKTKKDIRVVVGKVSEMKDSFEKVQKSRKFLAMAHAELCKAMDQEIDRNIKNHRIPR